MQHVYIIGSKGIPARYGGYETFVDKLTAGQMSPDIKYHVAARSDNSEYGKTPTFTYNGAEVYNIQVPNIGPAQAIAYDIKALRWAITNAKHNSYPHPIFYILACRIGPFMGHYVKQIHALGGKYFINPDGHEWKRSKWSKPVREYWKQSEKLMIKHADFVICDNLKIEEYIQTEYKNYQPNTTYIAYGTDTKPSTLSANDEIVRDWFTSNKIKENSYYLIVGRFVPENNYETMIKEFMASKSKKSLVIITNVAKNKFYKNLKAKTGFEKDSRIKFVGTVYDQQLLRYIRENAFGYLHGHEVGGTNPSLLEALSATKINLLINVNFNMDVARKNALYWSKETGSLAYCIDKADALTVNEIAKFSIGAKQRINRHFSWTIIIEKYETCFSIF